MISKIMRGTADISCATLGSVLKVAGLPFHALHTAFKTAQSANTQALSYLRREPREPGLRNISTVADIEEPGWLFVNYRRP